MQVLDGVVVGAGTGDGGVDQVVVVGVLCLLWILLLLVVVVVEDVVVVVEEGDKNVFVAGLCLYKLWMCC